MCAITARTASTGDALRLRYKALSSAAGWIGGLRTGLLAGLGLPFVALAGLFAIERESAVRDTVRAWFLLRRTKPGTRERLRRRRSELADVLDEVNAWLSESVETGS